MASTETSTTSSTETTTTMTTGETTTFTEATSTLATTIKPKPKTSLSSSSSASTTTQITTTSTTMTTPFTSTEMADEDKEKLPQGDQPRCEKLVKADVLFALHGIGGDDWVNVSTFIKTIGSSFDFKTGSFKLGLKENCKKLKLEPTEFGYLEDYNYAVDDVMTLELTPLLAHTKRAFWFSKRQADKVVILMVSGKVQDIENAYRFANNLKNKAKIIVVGVGKDIDTDQLKGLASYKDKSEPDISHVFPVSDPASLPKIVKKLNKLLCNEQP